jgi:outer membrane immunogenic protein
MLRQVFIAASALALATSAQAATETGPYVGVAATVDSYNFDLGAIDSVGATGVGGSAFAGYNVALGNGFFVSPEANIELSSAKADLTDGADTVRLKSRWGWGVGARAGYDINDSTAAYLRAGYARNQLRATANGVSDKSWLEGVRVGGGLETRLTDRTRLRAEYNHVNYEQDVTNNQGLLGIVYGF